MLKPLWIGLLIAVLLLMGEACFADGFASRETLRGITGMAVVVALDDPDAEREGLTRGKLQTDVELKLRIAGVKVLTILEAFGAAGAPTLFVRVVSLKGPPPLEEVYAYSTRVEFNQMTLMGRDPKTSITAPTWSSEGVGMAGRLKLEEVCRKAVSDHVDRFLNAHLAVNPKK